MSIAIQFVMTALIIVLAGTRLARYGDILGEKTGLGRNWIGMVLLAATTSLPELFTGIGATTFSSLPDIAIGDVLGSCMFNLLILSMMDAIHPEPIAARAHQGHALSTGFGLLLIGVVGVGLLASRQLPVTGQVGLVSWILIMLYFFVMRASFTYEKERRARETREVAEELHYAKMSLRYVIIQYVVAAVFVVGAAIWLPHLGAEIARQTGWGEAFIGSLFIAITTSLPEIAVSVAAVRIGAIDLGIANVLGSNMFNVLILGLDDVFYRRGALLADANPAHLVSVCGIVVMNALFLIALSHRALTKRFWVTWDTGAIAAMYVVSMALTFLMKG